jgi:hypothetical protein
MRFRFRRAIEIRTVAVAALQHDLRQFRGSPDRENIDLDHRVGCSAYACNAIVAHALHHSMKTVTLPLRDLFLP